MNIRSASAILFCLAVTCAAFLPSAQAEDWIQKTKLKFDQPIEIPGAVLPAGTYWFALQDGPFDHNLVRIFSADWSKIEATVWTVPIYRQQSIDDTEIEFCGASTSKAESAAELVLPWSLHGARIPLFAKT